VLQLIHQQIIISIKFIVLKKLLFLFLMVSGLGLSAQPKKNQNQKLQTQLTASSFQENC